MRERRQARRREGRWGGKGEERNLLQALLSLLQSSFLPPLFISIPHVLYSLSPFLQPLLPSSFPPCLSTFLHFTCTISPELLHLPPSFLSTYLHSPRPISLLSNLSTSSTFLFALLPPSHLYYASPSSQHPPPPSSPPLLAS